MNNEKSDLMPQVKRYHLRQNGFGQLLKATREAKGLSPERAAEILDISVRYYNELENDIRFCPTGDLYKRIKKEFFKDPAALQALQDAVGVYRDEVSPYLIEYLRKSWTARKVADILMQLDVDDMSDSIDEDYCSKLIELTKAWAKKRGVSLTEHYKLDVEDDDE
jgi:transcriptional regulator with XRE-family HTH domain